MEKDRTTAANTMATTSDEYEDLLQVMAEKLDAEAFVEELCSGFRLLSEPGREAITAESLRKNAALLGMKGMRKEEAEEMVREGDLNGDGVLDQNEFCVLMVRLSPEMMADAETLLHKALLADQLPFQSQPLSQHGV